MLKSIELLHTFTRSESVKLLVKSLCNRSWMNSSTGFGSMKTVDDISVTTTNNNKTMHESNIRLEGSSL